MLSFVAVVTQFHVRCSRSCVNFAILSFGNIRYRLKHRRASRSRTIWRFLVGGKLGVVNSQFLHFKTIENND